MASFSLGTFSHVKSIRLPGKEKSAWVPGIDLIPVSTPAILGTGIPGMLVLEAGTVVKVVVAVPPELRPGLAICNRPAGLTGMDFETVMIPPAVFDMIDLTTGTCCC